MNINKEEDRTSRARLGHCANRQRGIALATSAAALFATAIRAEDKPVGVSGEIPRAGASLHRQHLRRT